MCKFYNPNGTEIKTAEDFLDFYEQVYFFLLKDRKQEEKIEEILKNGIRKGDTEVILCWKTGGKAENGYVKHQYGSIEVEPLEKLILSNNPKAFEAEKLVNELIKQSHIGFVYAVTLLHFFSKGEYPIYDRFAHTALKAILGQSDFSRIIKQNELDKKIHKDNEKKRFGEYQNSYVKGIEKIRKLCKTELPGDRKIDRALWAYGHLFNDKKSNRTKG